MLDKLKNLNNIRKTQSQIKKQLEQIYISNEHKSILVKLRGDKRVERIVINGEENKDLKDLLNDTMKKVDKKVEKQMRGQLGDLGFPGL
jgi:DNA-binding protein YbaB